METTEISTPENTDIETTSSEEPAQADTSSEEVESSEPSAEKPEEHLFAGKYKSVEELEKGYAEAQKTLTQNLQIKAKYDELVQKQQQQEAKLLQQAREQGYNTADEQQIAQQVALAELNEFINGLNYYVEPESQITVQQYLNAYRQTGDVRYLNEAKRYFPSDFLENTAVAKLNLQNQLKNNFEQESRKKAQKADEELALSLKNDYAEFIETVKADKGASKALELFCNAGFIQSKDDMEAFKSIYEDIVSFAKQQAVKEYEAQKTIEKTKQAAKIETGANTDTNLETKPSPEQLAKMSAQDYNKAVQKYGLENLFKGD